MQLHYGQVWGYVPDFLVGACIALIIALVAFSLGLLIGLGAASTLNYGPRPARIVVRAYVSF